MCWPPHRRTSPPIHPISGRVRCALLQSRLSHSHLLFPHAHRLVFRSLARMGYGGVHWESPVPLFMPLHVPTMAPSFPPSELFSSFRDHLRFQNPDADTDAGNEKDGSRHLLDASRCQAWFFPRSYLNIKFVPTVILRGSHCYLNFADEKTGGRKVIRPPV